MFEFTQQLPPPDLRNWVRLVWTLVADLDSPGDTELVIPDGHAELIFNLGAPFHQRSAGHAEFREQPSSILNGQIRSAVMLQSPRAVRLVGIRIQPWALGALIRQSAERLTDMWQPLQAVAARLLPNLEDVLRDAFSCAGLPGNLAPDNHHTPNTVFEIVAQHLRASIAGTVAPSSRLAQVVKHVAATASSRDLALVRNDVGMSERNLQRLFASEVGMTAKHFVRITRIQRAIKLRRSDGRCTWVRAAMNSGYYDQSHFIKDFREVVGCTPTELMVEPKSLTHHLIDDSSHGRD